ncbi:MULTISPECIES: restriction endonuclease subunit S [unclassified Empedobacter]|uniref:restriction endonuclease subunit S n=1 Tax=Empedobacter TaxID=59734 RepID=UPI0025BD01A6|nr:MULTISPECIES: restriction endonuclease subunit S [unclassified Empedobacter]
MKQQNTSQPKLRFPEFSGDWNKSKIQNLSKFIGGGTPDTSNTEFWDGDIPWISSSDINENEITNINITRYISKNALENSATKLIPKGSLLVVSRVGVGKFAIASQDICTSQDFTNLILDENIINNLFLAYQLYSNRNVLYKISQGTSIKGFTSNDLKTVSVFITSLPEQQKIADYLTTIDKKIELLTEKKTELSRYKKAMMQKLFAQEIRFKDENGNDYPEWEEKRLGDVGTFYSGQGFNEKEQGGDIGVPFIKVSDMNLVGNEIFIKSANNYVTDFQINKNNYKVISSSTILFAKVGAAIFLERKRIGENLIIDNNMMGFTPNGNIIYYYYIFQNIRLSKYAQTGALPSYNSKDIGTIKVNISSIQEQNKIANFLSAIDESITKVEEQIKETQNFKKAMLQQLFV